MNLTTAVRYQASLLTMVLVILKILFSICPQSLRTSFVIVGSSWKGGEHGVVKNIAGA